MTMRFPAIACLLLAACAAAPGPETGGAAPAGVVLARLGETAQLGGTSVRPIAVVEDSRCPSDVTCVWAGRLRLRVAISGGIGETELILGQPHALRTGALTLVSATPEPRHNPPPGMERGPANRFGFSLD